MSEMKKSVSNLGIRSRVFDFKTMEELLPEAVFKRFQSDLLTGASTSPKDRKVIADTIYDWAKSKGAMFITQWFFPMRGGKGMVGGRGGMKHDSMIDLDWGYPGIRKVAQGICFQHKCACTNLS